MEILEGKSYYDASIHNNLRELFKTAVAKFANYVAYAWRPVLTDNNPTEVTFSEMDRDIDALQLALYDATQPARRIAIVGVNSYHWAISYNATVMGLGMAVPLDPLLTAVEIVSLLQRSKADTLICDARFMSLLHPHLHELPHLKKKICMLRARETGKKQEQCEQLLHEDGYVDFDTVLAEGHARIAAGERYVVPDIPPDQTAALLFTSGTTSESKGVLLSHYNITSNVAGLQRIITIPEQFRYLSILPLHHALENTCGLHTVLSLGGCICACDGLRYINQNLLEYKPMLLIGVPALYDSFQKKILMGIKKQGKERSFARGLAVSSFLRRIGIDIRRRLFRPILEQLGGEIRYCISGAAHQRVEVTKFFDALGIHLCQGYGLTECAPVVAGANFIDNPHGTCGFPLGGLTIAIDNERPGEDGEILVKKGSYPSVDTATDARTMHIAMQGYYENSEANAEVFAVDGWIRTMDIGHIDPKTRGLVLTGRAKSMIVLNSGKKVFPEEIESKLNGVELIQDSLVWAEPDHNDVVLVARLVLDPEYYECFQRQCTEKGLSKEETRKALESSLQDEITRINGEMIKFKRIRHFYYSCEDMIRTTTRKTKRKLEVERIHRFFKEHQYGSHLPFDVHALDSIGCFAFEESEQN